MYAKIFRQIFESSIAENYELRHIFMDLLVLADKDGVVDATPESISRVTNIPLERIQWAIAELSKPDPRSRNPDGFGIRLKKLDDHRDWGWAIVNFDLYHKMASEDQRREKTRERVKAFRIKNRNISPENPPCNAPVTQCNDHVTPPSMCTCTSSSPNTSLDQIQKFKDEISSFFKRESGDPWSYFEETTLLDLMKRPNFAKELETIERYFMRGDKWFKQSVTTLLADWTAVLDRARKKLSED